MGKFPQIEDFILTGNLGLLNYFIIEILQIGHFGREKIFAFLNQDSFNWENLKRLLDTSYHPALYDFHKILAKYIPEKLAEFRPKFDKLTDHNLYLNRYHKAIISVFGGKSSSVFRNSTNFFLKSTSYLNEYSWYGRY